MVARGLCYFGFECSIVGAVQGIFRFLGFSNKCRTRAPGRGWGVSGEGFSDTSEFEFRWNWCMEFQIFVCE